MIFRNVTPYPSNARSQVYRLTDRGEYFGRKIMLRRPRSAIVKCLDLFPEFLKLAWVRFLNMLIRKVLRDFVQESKNW
jgi:hypothetical protein